MKHALQKVFFLSVLVIPTLFYATEMNKQSFLSENNFDSAIDVAHSPLGVISFEVVPNDSNVVDVINLHVLANDVSSNDAPSDDVLFDLSRDGNVSSNHILSNVMLPNDILSNDAPLNDALLTNNASNDLSLPILFRGDVSPANTTYTIDRSGVYQLTSAKTASGVANISITANNVTLDLGGNTLSGGTNGIEISGNNITVSNGTITGMSQNGVLIQGSSCRVENCDVVASPTGITLQNTSECVVENCRVCNMTQTGVSLQSTWTSVMRGCEISGVHGVGSVYGVLAQNGGNNSAYTCVVRDMQTNSSTGSDKVVGIACAHETASTLSDNTIQAIESLTTVSAYGVWIEGGNNATITNNNVTNVATNNGLGQGVFVNQVDSYVANNLCFDCDYSFTGVSSEFITSQANARGVYNIDTNFTTPDTVAVMHEDQLPMIESQLDGLLSVVPDIFFTVESKLDILAQCESTAVTAAGTLSTDYGIYCLGNNITGQLSITGTGIDFDLSGHVINANSGTNGLVISGDDVSVHNGTVRNASASGVKITGNKCVLDKLVSYGNLTGFEFANADNNIVTNCSAINNTREGYLLATSDYNSFTKCRAINTSGSSAVAGIKTTGGTSNRFDACDINGVASSAGEAYGLLASNEQKSSSVNCAVNGVSGASYTAGVAFIGDYLGTPTAQDFVSVNAARQNKNIDWLNTPVGSYIASAYALIGAARTAQVDQFSPMAGLTSVGATGSLDDYVYCVKWLTWNNQYYLAILGYGNGAGVEIIVYLFDPAAGTFTEAGTFQYTTSPSACLGGDWVIAGTVPYLLYTGGYNVDTGVQELGALRYNGSTLTKVTGVDFPASAFPYNVDAHLVNGKWKLAVTGFDGTSATKPLVEIYTFDDPQGSASLTLSTTNFDVTTAGRVLNTSWLEYDGQTYLAIGITDNASAPTVHVLKYTDSSEDLVPFATYDYSAAVQGVDWLVTGTTVYLAVSGDLANNRTTILKFDPYQGSATTRLSNFYNCTAENVQSYGLRWNRVVGADNRVYLAVGKLGTASVPYLRVFGFDINGQSQLNLVSDNTISDVAGGSGLLVDTVINGVTGNRAYNCQDGLVEGVQTTYPGSQFDDSNWNVPHA